MVAHGGVIGFHRRGGRGVEGPTHGLLFAHGVFSRRGKGHDQPQQPRRLP